MARARNDARTYTNTMNCVMAGNSCEPRRTPIPPPPNDARVFVRRARGHRCFSRFSRCRPLTDAIFAGKIAHDNAARFSASKTVGKAENPHFAYGYCSRPTGSGGGRPDGRAAVVDGAPARERWCLQTS